MSAAENLKSDTLRDLEARLAAVPPGRYTAPEQQRPAEERPRLVAAPRSDLAEAIARARELHGLRAPLEVVHRCACGAEVKRRGDSCGKCDDGRDTRRALLGRARATLPGSWDHAVLGEGIPVHPQILAAVTAWKARKGNLLLCGLSGIGKTTAVVARARQILEQAEAQRLGRETMALAVGLRMVSARDLATCRAKNKLGEESTVEATARSARILILDEVGFEEGFNSEAVDVISDVMDARYCPKGEAAPKTVTITTSGKPLADLVKRYGIAVVRRMGHGRGGRAVDVPEAEAKTWLDAQGAAR
jgi:hypothetical protein